jgi:hypothetical protein
VIKKETDIEKEKERKFLREESITVSDWNSLSFYVRK